MAKLNVPPTKTMLLSMKRQLAFAEEGHELLDQKREILVLELMRLVERAKRAQAEVNEKMASAFSALVNASVTTGELTVQTHSLGVSYDHQNEILQHRLMGISVPSVERTHEKLGLRFGMHGTNAHTDEVMAKFLDALDSIAELAEVETSVWRLARELKKTQRRVNALERIFIPDFGDTVKYITGTLEEKDREAFFTMKMVKKRLEAAREEGD